MRIRGHRTRAGGLAASLAAGLLAAGCASAGGGWFQLGPHPAALAGVWVDSSSATPTDTVAWVLAANGQDRTLVVHVLPSKGGGANTTPAPVTRRETRYGFWYLKGALGDTARQALCFQRRVRDGASCAPFRLDTVPAGAGTATRRRLRVLGFGGAHRTGGRVLVERR